jgi:thioredoxin
MEVTNFDREVLGADGPVLVEFGGKWCEPCKALLPILEAIEKEGTAHVMTVDVDDHPELAACHGVRGVPTVLAFDGGALKGRIVGLTTKDRLLALFR